jgi:soluble lytic murein transglycosylase
MIFRHLFVVLALLPATALAAPKPSAADEALLRAYDGFRAGDPLKLQRASSGLSQHVLAPYLEYWRLKLRLEEMPEADVRAFLERQAGSYLADRLRADWLRELGKRGQWEKFDRELGPLVQDDLEIRCYAWLSRLERGDQGAFEEAKAAWLEPRELPESCDALADKMIGADRIRVPEVWQRLRMLFENGLSSGARRAMAWLPEDEKPNEALFNTAVTAPKRLLAHLPRGFEQRPVREMMLFAVVRLARAEPEAAAEFMRGKLAARFSEEEQRYLWGRIAYEGARRLLPEARSWYRLAGNAPLGDEQLAWKARAALRAADWETLRDAVDRMSVVARQDPAWSYWYGRALAAQGNAEGARAYFLRVAGAPHFYGLLAAEELGYVPAVPEPFHVPTEEEVAAAARVPGLARAMELYRLDLRSEATREWRYTLRGMDDAQLLAAAELARRAEIFDRAINTASETTQRHNYRLRFLAPYREVFSEHARAFALEEAWVLGLVRQESRFIVNARSSAGAQGLMQIMPATARWVARQIGMKNYQPARVAEIPTNIVLGTRYLKFVLDDLGHPVLASAAYNAGPGRARRWRDVQPLEGAIYAETIPFPETRDYVKRVMANTMYYAQLNGGKLVPLKERLGRIPARVSGERVSEEIP